MRIQRRHVGYTLGTIAVVLLLARLLRPTEVPVEVAEVTVGPLLSTVGDEGRTRVRRRHIIAAPVSGRVERLTLAVGDSVSSGMVVARIAPAPLDPRARQQAEAALAAARDLEQVSDAAVGEARTALEQAQADRRRAEALLPGGGVAVADVERLQLTERARARVLDAADARARAARHDVEAARAALQAAGAEGGGRTLALRCPVGGRVLAITEQSERTVQAGESLLEVGDPGALEVVVDLLSSDAVKVAPGQRMLLSGWGRDSVLEGRVRRVEPAAFTKVSALGVEEQRVNVIGDFDAPPPGLGDGYRLDVRLVLWEGTAVRKVPASALFRRGDRWALFVVSAGRAVEREVTVGHESESETEIRSGVAEGDIVIRHPTDRVRDGVRVRPASTGS